MRNPAHTRATILTVSAALFNTKGYKATSLSDVTTATGFTKGAIYKHFTNKEDLEQQALRSLGKIMHELLSSKIKQENDFTTQMEAIFNFFKNYVIEPPYAGGCPLVNSAVESDDGNAALRQQSFGMLVNLKSIFKRVIETGIKNGQLKSDVAVDQQVYVLIASLEGAVLLSKLERNNHAITACIDFLRKTNASLLAD